MGAAAPACLLGHHPGLLWVPAWGGGQLAKSPGPLFAQRDRDGIKLFSVGKEPWVVCSLQDPTFLLVQSGLRDSRDSRSMC